MPHYLPGQNPWLGEFEAKHAMPKDGVRGGAETLLPEWKPGAPRAAIDPAKNGGFKPEGCRSASPPGDVKAVHVQGNVHMIVGAGPNIVVQVGEDGVLVVDTGSPARRQRRCWRRSSNWRRRRRSAGSSTPVCRPDHIGGNEALREGGPDGQRQRRRDRRARECVGANDQGGSARRRAAVQHLLRETGATSRSTTSRSCSITTSRRSTIRTRW